MNPNILESQPNTCRTSISQIRSKFTNLISSLGKNNRKIQRSSSLKQDSPEMLRQFRVDDYEAYTGLKQNILNTFSIPNSKLYQEIFVLNKNLNQNQTHKVEKTMQKLSIKLKSRENSLESIDTQFISKMYIIQKSKEKRKQLLMAARKEKKEDKKEMFFCYQKDKIRDFQRSFNGKEQDNAKHFKITQHKKRKESDNINIKKSNRQKNRLQSESKQLRSKSDNQKHPIVSIFDDQSSKMFRNYKSKRMVDLIQTQPYQVYEQDPESIDYPLLPNIDLKKIRRNYESARNNFALVKINSEQKRRQ